MAKKPLSASDLAPPKVEKQAEEMAKLQETLAEKEAAIVQLQTQADQLKNELMRSMATQQNTEKRLQKQLQSAEASALFHFAKDLLPIEDSLAQAKSSASEQPAIAEGLTLTLSLLEKVFTQHHIQRINPLGESFDPMWHEAMSTGQDPEQANNQVLEVFQVGYRIKDRLIRPALVVVNKQPST